MHWSSDVFVVYPGLMRHYWLTAVSIGTLTNQPTVSSDDMFNTRGTSIAEFNASWNHTRGIAQEREKIFDFSCVVQ